MELRYYVRHLVLGCISVGIAGLYSYAVGDSFHESPVFFSWMAISTLCYPCARYLVQVGAYRISGSKFWTDTLPSLDSNYSASEPLLIFFCLLFALPLGLLYLLFEMSKK